MQTRAAVVWPKSIPSGRSRFFRWRMRSGFFLLPLIFVLARPTRPSLIAALVVAVTGLALRLWASGYIEKDRKLATGGPYAHTRHPLYVGNALLAVGLALASASPWALVLVAAYVAAFYPPIMRTEDRFLSQTFPADFESWAREVPGHFPCLRAKGPGGGAFRWRRVWANREWRAWLASAALFALLAVSVRT